MRTTDAPRAAGPHPCPLEDEKTYGREKLAALLCALSDARKEISELKDALRMIITDISAPDALLQRGYVCNLTAMQQHGIIKARRLTK